MDEKFVTAKAAISAFFTALGVFLGWKGIMALVWAAVMALDYISGTMAACKKGDWCSATARQGLWHKGGMILVVVVSAIADGIMAVICANMPLDMAWPGVILPLVLAWYIITELGSILENAVKLGANVPNWLVRLLKASMTAVESVGDAAVGQNADGAVILPGIDIDALTDDQLRSVLQQMGYAYTDNMTREEMLEALDEAQV